jgi:hypothetical protein
VTTLIENELLSHAGGDDYTGSLLAVPIDAHPLIREYFAAQLKRDQPEAFRAAHSRLFDYLCKNTPHRPDGIDGLAPLYEAVTHGCLAGRQQEACEKVYRDRILRGTGSDGFYSTRKLGAIGADLAAVAAVLRRAVEPGVAEPDRSRSGLAAERGRIPPPCPRPLDRSAATDACRVGDGSSAEGLENAAIQLPAT